MGTWAQSTGAVVASETVSPRPATPMTQEATTTGGGLGRGLALEQAAIAMAMAPRNCGMSCGRWRAVRLVDIARCVTPPRCPAIRSGFLAGSAIDRRGRRFDSCRSLSRPGFSPTGVRCDVMKLDDEHSSSGTVLRNPQQVDDADKAAAPRQLRRDIRETDLEHPGHDDLAGRKRITSSDLHMWFLPQANSGRDFAVADRIAKLPMELHLADSRGSSDSARSPRNPPHAP